MTMFGPELMREMAALAEGMRPGAVFVTVMLPLPSDAFEVVCCHRALVTITTFNRHRGVAHNSNFVPNCRTRQY